MYYVFDKATMSFDLIDKNTNCNKKTHKTLK